MTVAEILVRWLGIDAWLPNLYAAVARLGEIARAVLTPQPRYKQLVLPL